MKEHQINEVAMLHWGRSKYDTVEAVILDCGDEWAGFYVYSKDEEAALEWARDDA